MISLWPSTIAAIASLNDSLTVLEGSVEELKAAQSVNIAEVIEQLKVAAEASRNLHVPSHSPRRSAESTARPSDQGITIHGRARGSTNHSARL